MSQTSPAIRKLVGRACVVAAVVSVGWAVAVYPIAFEYAWREGRAAGESKLGFIPYGVADLASGWFTTFLIISGAAASLSLGEFRDVRSWRVVAWFVLLVCCGLVGVHAFYDGPMLVAGNLWWVVTHPGSFYWPLDYFTAAVNNWGTWP